MGQCTYNNTSIVHYHVNLTYLAATCKHIERDIAKQPQMLEITIAVAARSY